MSWGRTLSSEEHGPCELADMASDAEHDGFSFVSISDHFHPWTSDQGHSPFVWSVIGAIAGRCSSIPVSVAVSCPIIRVHPAIVAQAAATCSRLLGPSRLSLGVGTGEALNEHVTGEPWPPPPVRREMLAEAVSVIRELWSGETVSRRGEHFVVDRARLFDPPDGSVPITVSGFGPAAIELAAEIGDGYWGHSTDGPGRFAAAGGTGPRYAQIQVCVHEDERAAREIAASAWPTSALPGQLAQDLPTPQHFEDAVAGIPRDDRVESIPCGPDPEPIVELARAHAEAGYTHIAFHQVGTDQEPFRSMWASSLRDALAPISTAAAA